MFLTQMLQVLRGEEKKTEFHCRLDLFLISNTLYPTTNNTELDHSMIIVRNNTAPNPRGLGFWKLNTQFLAENDRKI